MLPRALRIIPVCFPCVFRANEADSVKSAMQTERELGGPGARTGFWDTFLRIYRARGLHGLYAGLGVTCLRSAPSSGTCVLTSTRIVCMH